MAKPFVKPAGYKENFKQITRDVRIFMPDGVDNSSKILNWIHAMVQDVNIIAAMFNAGVYPLFMLARFNKINKEPLFQFWYRISLHTDRDKRKEFWDFRLECLHDIMEEEIHNVY